MPPWRQKLLREQLEPAAANVTIIGEGDPGAFDGLPPTRLAEDAQRRAAKVPWYLKAVRAGRYRWTGCGWPTPYWAGQVYPELEPDAATRKLADDLLWFCRLGPDDPPGTQGWEAHADALAQRAETLTGLGIRRLELHGDGTALEMAVPETARWVGGREDDAHGRRVSPNFPTEENFTSPVPGSTRGTFRCSRPLSFRGRLIDGHRRRVPRRAARAARGGERVRPRPPGRVLRLRPRRLAPGRDRARRPHVAHRPGAAALREHADRRERRRAHRLRLGLRHRAGRRRPAPRA